MKHNKIYVCQICSYITTKTHKFVLVAVINKTEFHHKVYDEPLDRDFGIYDFMKELDTIYGSFEHIIAYGTYYYPGFLKFRNNEGKDYSITAGGAEPMFLEEYCKNLEKTINETIEISSQFS